MRPRPIRWPSALFAIIDFNHAAGMIVENTVSIGYPLFFPV